MEGSHSPLEFKALEEIARLRATLEMVEWHRARCPWCNGIQPDFLTNNPCAAPRIQPEVDSYGYGHTPDCPRQAALHGNKN